MNNMKQYEKKKRETKEREREREREVAKVGLSPLSGVCVKNSVPNMLGEKKDAK